MKPPATMRAELLRNIRSPFANRANPVPKNLASPNSPVKNLVQSHDIVTDPVLEQAYAEERFYGQVLDQGREILGGNQTVETAADHQNAMMAQEEKLRPEPPGMNPIDPPMPPPQPIMPQPNYGPLDPMSTVPGGLIPHGPRLPGAGG